MKTPTLILLGAVALCVGYLIAGDGPEPPPDTKPCPCPCPAPCPCPDPCPCPKPDPKPDPKKPDPAPKRPRPWGDQVGGRSVSSESQVPGRKSAGKIALGGKSSPDGKVEIQVDVPHEQRIKNIGSKKDGAGMCVFSSCEVAARWQLLEQLRGIRDWCAQQPGGGYPAKVDKQLKEFCAAKGLTCPSYLQYEGPSDEVMIAALQSGRLPACTYSGSDGARYKGPISHMVNICHLDQEHACVLDNNYNPEKIDTEYLWMSREEFLKRWKSGSSGWCVVWPTPPPPPPPSN